MQNILGHEPFKSRVFRLRGENWEVCKYFEGKQLATGLIYYKFVKFVKFKTDSIF